jgi:hypothetical protein
VAVSEIGRRTPPADCAVRPWNTEFGGGIAGGALSVRVQAPLSRLCASPPACRE